MNIKLKNISEWLKTNKLCINIDKTNFINNETKIISLLKHPLLPLMILL